MADTLVDNALDDNNLNTDALWGPYWSDENVGVIVFAADAFTDPIYSRTEDGGVTWVETTIETIADTALIVRAVTFTTTGNVTIGTLILCDATAGAFTITLPLAGAQEGSRILIIK